MPIAVGRTHPETFVHDPLYAALLTVHGLLALHVLANREDLERATLSCLDGERTRLLMTEHELLPNIEYLIGGMELYFGRVISFCSTRDERIPSTEVTRKYRLAGFSCMCAPCI